MRTLSKFIRPGVSFASIIGRKKPQKIPVSKNKGSKVPKAVDTNNNQKFKRCRSNESVCEEPPSKTKVSESCNNPSQSAVPLMEYTTIEAEVHVDADELLASLPDLAPCSVGASSSFEVASVGPGAFASQHTTPVLAGGSAPLVGAAPGVVFVPVPAATATYVGSRS